MSAIAKCYSRDLPDSNTHVYVKVQGNLCLVIGKLVCQIQSGYLCLILH